MDFTPNLVSDGSFRLSAQAVIRSLSRKVIPPLIALCLGIGGWAILTPSGRTIRIIPSPVEVVEALFADLSLLLREYIPITVLETVIGLGLSVGIGVGIAALLDLSAGLRRALYPLLIITQTIPLFALAPVLTLLLGFGIEPKITLVVLFCSFPIALNTLDGFTATPAKYVALMDSCGAGKWGRWRWVRLPYALPFLFSGLRIAATYSVTGAILGEYIAPTAGLGKYMRSAYQSFRTEQAFAAALVVILLSLMVVGVVTLIERRVIRWFFLRQSFTSIDEENIR
jgi:ABC-type nitrate/sulfonate/bicarbonate transport system permease component